MIVTYYKYHSLLNFCRQSGLFEEEQQKQKAATVIEFRLKCSPTIYIGLYEIVKYYARWFDNKFDNKRHYPSFETILKDLPEEVAVELLYHIDLLDF